LWRDFAVRSAGFAVSGLDVFGAREGERLREVARNPSFREAVTWQNRGALSAVLDKVADDVGDSPSRVHRREEVVASYWQRYCAKNDTIGFFGPLAWGRFSDEGPAIVVRSGALIAEREVHFEAWCIELLAGRIDDSLTVPLGPHPERELRLQLERCSRSEVRERGLVALGRLEAALHAVATAERSRLAGELAALESVFVELTGREPVRSDDLAEGGRTLVYLDCVRELEIDLGPTIVGELASSLPPLLASARWYCGEIFEIGRRLITEVLDPTRPQPLAPVFGRLFGTLMQLPDELPSATAELQRRWTELLADRDPETLGDRAAVAFADYKPAWSNAVYYSPDVQIAARDVGAINAGRFLAVVGDFHPGINPLGQGIFANRHPDRERFLSDWASDVGSPQLFMIPPRAPGVQQTSRNMPAVTRPDDIHIRATTGAPMPEGYRTVSIGELIAEGEQVTDRRGSFHAPLTDLFALPFLLAAVKTYQPFAVADHVPRLTIGRTVLHRETWSVRADELPTDVEETARWARSNGILHRVFCRTPLARKPIYVDLASPVLTNALGRILRKTAAEHPNARVQFAEMLPAAEDCWLDHDGNRYTNEFRIAAVDLTRRARTTTPVGHREEPGRCLAQ
jgi:Lantibiotic dehydratase, N terminus